MRLARLLQVLTAIEGKSSLRPADLARLCEVCERTIYRDIQVLQMAGVPVYFDNGYKLGPNFFLPPLKFTLEEAVSIVVGGGAFVQQPGTPYRRAAEAALAKVLAALPGQLRKLTLNSTQAMLFDAQPVIDYRLHAGVFDQLEQARQLGQTVEIAYQSTGRPVLRRREVDAYAWLYRGRRWYLIAYCHRRRQVRMFRVDRIREIQETPRRYELPADFSVEGYLGNAWRVVRGQPKLVRVRFKNGAADVIQESTYHASQKLERDGSALIMSVSVGNPLEMVPWLLGFGPDAEVLEPEELRQAVAERAAAMAAMYG